MGKGCFMQLNWLMSGFDDLNCVATVKVVL